MQVPRYTDIDKILHKESISLAIINDNSDPNLPMRAAKGQARYADSAVVKMARRCCWLNQAPTDRRVRYMEVLEGR